jgi:tRNA 2-selenouridine synthase
VPINILEPQEWVDKSLDGTQLVLDVRSPAEFQHAHIPGATNLPLFSDEERAIIGTLYKQTSRESAIKEGLDFFGPKMRNMVETVESLLSNPEHPLRKEVFVHCWRGGMRSMAVAWLLDMYGFKVTVLQGGYKGFRNWVLQQFKKEYPFTIVGGNTGTGKTRILYSLQKMGYTMIDLEALAHHKGSAFGNIGMPTQPSQEMFENKLASALFQCRNSDVIWVEDESQRIGDVNIPSDLWQCLIKKNICFIQLPFDLRLDNIVREYGNLERERLVNAVIRIRKRLGGLETQNTINHLIDDNITEAFRILLRYYDKFYEKSLSRKDNVTSQLKLIESAINDPDENAVKIITFWQSIMLHSNK